MECPGEDPHVTSVYARAYVRGMQGDDPSGIFKTICTPKHFVGQLFEGDSSDPWGNGTTGGLVFVSHLKLFASETFPSRSRRFT
jgi:hypothetical protein